MSYSSVADLSADNDLRRRMIACAALEQVDNPVGLVDENIWKLAATPGWGDAYEYAQQTGVQQPGKAPGVISDAMILAAVQPLALAVPE